MQNSESRHSLQDTALFAFSVRIPTPDPWLLPYPNDKYLRPPTSSPSELDGVNGKGEGGKGLNLLPFSLSPFPSPHLAFLGWQTTT